VDFYYEDEKSAEVIESIKVLIQ